jgi:hypothetical protein
VGGCLPPPRRRQDPDQAYAHFCLADSQQQTSYQPSHWDSTRIRRASEGSDFYANVPTGDHHQPTTLPPLNQYIMSEATNRFDSNGRIQDGSDRNSDIVGPDDLSRHSTSPLSASGTALSSVPHPHHHHHHHHSHSHAMSSTVYQPGMTTTSGPSSSSLQHSPKATRQHKQRDTYSTASVPRSNRTKPSTAIRGVNGKLPRQQREMSDPCASLFLLQLCSRVWCFFLLLTDFFFRPRLVTLKKTI